MAARALDFAVAHPSSDVSYNTLVGRLKDRLARADQLVMQQESGKSGEQAAKAHRADVRDTLMRVQLRHLVGVAEMAAKDHPEMRKLFRAPKAGSPLKVVISSAKALLEAAVPQKELFASVGMGDTFLDELTAAVAEFDRSTSEAHLGNRTHVGATGELPLAAEDCVKMTKLMDGLYRIRFKNDPESLTAWESARNVVAFTRAKKGDVPVPVAPVVSSPATGMA